MDLQAEKDKTERVTGLGRRTREKIAKWNQMTGLRFQTGGRHQTSPASLRGRRRRRRRHNLCMTQFPGPAECGLQGQYSVQLKEYILQCPLKKSDPFISQHAKTRDTTDNRTRRIMCVGLSAEVFFFFFSSFFYACVHICAHSK